MAVFTVKVFLLSPPRTCSLLPSVHLRCPPWGRRPRYPQGSPPGSSGGFSALFLRPAASMATSSHPGLRTGLLPGTWLSRRSWWDQTSGVSPGRTGLQKQRQLTPRPGKTLRAPAPRALGSCPLLRTRPALSFAEAVSCSSMGVRATGSDCQGDPEWR